MPHAIIFANGELPNLAKARALIKDADFIIAADGGTRHILAMGLTAYAIIGDLDSLPVDFRPLPQTKIIEHPPDKNETDLELAIQYALTLGPSRITILAGLGGRIDQTLANISLLTDPRLSSLDIRLDDGLDEILFCREQAQVKGRSGDIVSLIPWGVEVTGVSTQNLKWPLKKETLFPEKSRGVSNEMTGTEANISIDSGLLLIAHARSTAQFGDI